MCDENYLYEIEERNLQILKKYNGRVQDNSKKASKNVIESILALPKRIYTKVISHRPPEENLSEKVASELVLPGLIKPKIAIYTCIIGGYDEPQIPRYNASNTDFFIFSDKKIESSIWKQKPIPNKLLDMDNILVNRYIKMHPSEFFEEYDFAIYIDGNVRVISDVTGILQLINTNYGIGLHKHARRNSVYTESKVLKIYKKGNKEKINKQIKKYKQDRFPNNYGLLEATIIVSEISNTKSIEILCDWWEEFCLTKSYRDQLSLPYILWKKGIQVDDIGVLGNNLYRNPKFQVIEHI